MSHAQTSIKLEIKNIAKSSLALRFIVCDLPFERVFVILKETKFSVLILVCIIYSSLGKCLPLSQVFMRVQTNQV